MENKFKVQTCDPLIKEDRKSQLEKEINKFLESCVDLDASIFEPYMREEDVFDDKDKYRFLADLKNLFDKTKMLAGKDFNVIIGDRNCKGCSLGRIVKHFVVVDNKTNRYVGSFGFLIDAEDGMLKNIYRCLLYKETKKVWMQPQGLPGISTNRHKEEDW